MAIASEGRLQARREAPLHVQLELTSVPVQCPEGPVPIGGRIVTVLRGQAMATPGVVVEFPLWVVSSGNEPTGPACVYHDSLVGATHMELYMYGRPPKSELAAYEFTLLAAPSAMPVLSDTKLEDEDESNDPPDQAMRRKGGHLW